MNCFPVLVAGFIVVQLVISSVNAEEFREKTELTNVTAIVVAENLDHPWSLAFLPDGRMLVTERSGQLKLLSYPGRQQTTVTGMPKIAAGGQGGLLDIALHPEFNSNGLIYFSYVSRSESGRGTEVARAKLDGSDLKNLTVLFRMSPKSSGTRHFGSRLVFDNNGHLFITLGDRGDKHRAQRIDDHAGSVVRLLEDGSVPADNHDFGGGSAKELFSIGHRNIQGAFIHPDTGVLWTHEHGPKGGDELNIVRAGKNYGWPVITYGVNYGFGTKIGEGTEKQGLEQPLYYWVPSIAPSGMTFYTGDKVPQWKNNVFVGSLKFRTLVRLELDGTKVVHEERLFENTLGRIRDVRTGPDGFLYVLTDAGNGKLLRIEASP